MSAGNPNVEGQATVEVELRLPSGKIVPFSRINVVHSRSVITESIKAPSTHELHVQAPTTDYVDNLVRFAQSQGTPKLRYRVGLGLPGQMSYLPWQDQIVTSLSATLDGVGKSAGHFARLTLSDYLFTMTRQSKVVTRKGRVSDIVAQIAKENGITNAVIEETVGDGSWIQSFVDDFDFILNRMVPRAINSKGRGNYGVYVQDNTLHFHSPDYDAALKELAYFQTSNVGLMQMDESQHLLEQGASGVRLIVFDPYTGQSKEVSSDPAKALKLGNVMHQLANVKGADLSYPFHLSTNSPAEAENMAQAIYESARSQILGIKLDVARSIFLRVGDIVRLIISPSGDKATVWSGTYLVTDACYVVEGGGMMSSFVVKRGEFQSSRVTAAPLQILGDTVIISEQEAPGQALDLKAVQSSRLTHGAGQAAFTSVFSTTQPKNTALQPSAGR